MTAARRRTGSVGVRLDVTHEEALAAAQEAVRST
jgi:hypothetical protein